ncbi:polysaccharide deacetylase family protein [uncultured Pseudokineococcus sp.]|uniref:polysaccharide deacetylase family protein n=1 Tax=uncultured Pseudokineococcus sp. TaxID=1642928 RepID=UPI00261F25EE|nr:polysaccharide deacetylase family protein [uncultured Pseudokineococcus sp.]
MTTSPLRRTRLVPLTAAALTALALAAAPLAPATAARPAPTVSVSAATREAPGGTVPAVVTVKDVPPGYTVKSMSGAPATTNEHRSVVSCDSGTWHNPVQGTTSRSCYLRLGPAGDYTMTGTAVLSKPGARDLTVQGSHSRAIVSKGYRTPRAMSQAEITTIARCGNTSKDVWLTFDDGGSAAQIRSILATLKKNDVKGRFFMNGTWRDKNPTLMREITSAGHLLGNHTYDHPSLEGVGDAELRRQIDKGVKATTKPALLRPPYGAGSYNTRLTALARAQGCTVCRWTHDTSDWAGRTGAQMVEALRYGNASTAPVEAGGVVLMHGTAKHTSGSLQAIIDTVRGKELSLERLR